MKLTKEEMQALYKFLGGLSYYDLMAIMNRIYPEDNIDEKCKEITHIITRIFLELEKDG